MKRSFGLYFVILALFYGCGQKPEKLFEKVPSSTSNITFTNTLKESSKLNILNYLYYYNGAGVAAADFNNDEKIDLYFTSNQGADRLYLNKGKLQFEDVTKTANIRNSDGWTTGVTHIDINNDGLLDIYVCKVGNYKHLKGHNLLYVNQGLDENGVPIFKEDSHSYGLDFSGFSTQASFFDYDLDGDLDMYLMNHSVHPNRNYGKGSKREEIDSLSGDRLFQNENGQFIDVSQKADIFQGKIGYGLGLGIGDVNNDGYPDIYVGNDFFENDYLYINNKNGTFKDIISTEPEKLGHTTHFSMGNDLGDINNDALIDIVSLDMLPEDLKTYKASGLEYPYATYSYYLKNGYSPQYMQNTLHLNLGNERFSEISNLSGISATEWSWGALLADYDNDGYKDIFISNGIKGATNDMDFMNFIANENIQKRIDRGMSNEDMSFIQEIPQKKVANYFFKNNGDLTFSNVSNHWLEKEDSFSNGCTYADLDNDGDLDIIVNNVDEEAYLLENKCSSKPTNHYLKIKFKGSSKNSNGIGSKIIIYNNGIKRVNENFNTRGYLSAVPNTLHIGLGKDSILDSINIIWPNKKYQTLSNVSANQTIIADLKNANGDFYEKLYGTKIYSNGLETKRLVDFVHKEQTSIEFNRDPLIPFSNTNQGPSVSVADVNQDGLDDFFISGAKGQSSALYFQDKNGMFTSIQEDLFRNDVINEDISQIFFDADNDNDQDLLVVSGGNEFKRGKALKPRLYFNKNGVFVKDTIQFSDIEINASKVISVDFDNDNDQDVLLMSNQVPWEFGATPEQYMLQNDGKGNFTDITNTFSKAIKGLGNIKDAVWIDLDGNGFKDLIVVGHWMPISIFMNTGSSLELQTGNGLQNTNGWWNTILVEDFDKDGDIDFISGNWGLNSKFRASEDKPITLYRNDFDNNGSIETLVTYYYKNVETPFASKDELAKQMPYLNKDFLSYSDFAKASLNDLFTTRKLAKAIKKKVYELRTTLFINNGNGYFESKELPIITQSSVVNDIAVGDFNKDSYKDLLIVGNNYEISTQLGRMDALHGLILQNDKNGGFYWDKRQVTDIPGPARDIEIIEINNKEYYIIGINNDSPVFLRLEN